MPRISRIKNENYIYHVMCRSISEVKLFKCDKDKEKYLDIVKKYKDKLLFKVYDYCLMGNHVHLVIDVNGADISKIMQGINLSYVRYFNYKYKRHGHLFQDRFKSKVVTDNNYAMTLSRYIHQNPMEYKKYSKSPEKYKYSALRFFLGIDKDERKLVDYRYLLSLFGPDTKSARKKHLRCVMKYSSEEYEEIEREINRGDLEKLSEYRGEKKIIARIKTSDEVIKFMMKHLSISKNLIYMKNNREATQYRSLFVFLTRCFCDYSLKEIGAIIGNVTLACVSKLSSNGARLIEEDEKFENVIENFLSTSMA